MAEALAYCRTNFGGVERPKAWMSVQVVKEMKEEPEQAVYAMLEENNITALTELLLYSKSHTKLWLEVLRTVCRGGDRSLATYLSSVLKYPTRAFTDAEIADYANGHELVESLLLSYKGWFGPLEEA